MPHVTCTGLRRNLARYMDEAPATWTRLLKAAPRPS